MNLVHDLGVVVAGAAVVALLFHRWRWPVIFGYLLTGVLMAPNTFPWSPLDDLETVRQIAELGMIFMLFYAGLTFDLGRLQQVLGPALLAVVVQTATMLYLANLLGPILGMDALSSLFFGCLLAISSTMVTLRVLQDQGLVQQPFAQLAFGVVILEDFLAVALLVILNGVAVDRHFQWESAGLVVGLMAVFVLVVMVLGKLAVHRALALLGRFENRELLTLFSTGLVLGISVLAAEFRFSVGLGAFLAGAILSSARPARAIEEANRALHDVFNAVFFVSFGMLVDPRLLLANLPWIGLIGLLTVVGKTASCWLGLFLGGQSPRSSYRAAVAKSPIGEFSFIIAALGSSLGVTDERLTSITFGVALLTFLAIPALNRTADGHFAWLARHLPRPVRRLGVVYRKFFQTADAVIGRNLLLRLVRRPLLQILVYHLLIFAVILGASAAANWAAAHPLGGPGMRRLASAGIWGAACLALAPMLIAIIRNTNAIMYMVTEALFRGPKSRPVLRGKIRNLLNNLCALLVLLGVGGLFLSVASPFLPRGASLALFAALLAVVGALFWRQMIRLNSRLEYLVLEGLQERALDSQASRREFALREIAEKYPWPISLHEYVLPEEAGGGRTLRDLALRSRTGATIIALARGGCYHYDPGPEAVLFPGDTLVLLGNEAQIERALALLAEPGQTPARPTCGEFQVGKVLLPPDSPLVGNTLAGAELRHRFHLTVVGIQRGARQITSPGASEMLLANDLLVVAGGAENLQLLQRFAAGEAEG